MEYVHVSSISRTPAAPTSPVGPVRVPLDPSGRISVTTNIGQAGITGIYYCYGIG